MLFFTTNCCPAVHGWKANWLLGDYDVIKRHTRIPLQIQGYPFWRVA